MEWSGVEWSGVEWSGVGWSGVVVIIYSTPLHSGAAHALPRDAFDCAKKNKGTKEVKGKTCKEPRDNQDNKKRDGVEWSGVEWSGVEWGGVGW